MRRLVFLRSRSKHFSKLLSRLGQRKLLTGHSDSE
jgi:hypothetical protein